MRTANDDLPLTGFVVSTCVNLTLVSQEQRVLPAAGCIDDVKAFQSGDQRWLIVSLQYGLTQLSEVVATYIDKSLVTLEIQGRYCRRTYQKLELCDPC